MIHHMQLPFYKSFIYLNSPAFKVPANYTQYSILSHRIKIKQRYMVIHMAEISSNYKQVCIYENGYIYNLTLYNSRSLFNHASFVAATCKLNILNISVIKKELILWRGPTKGI